MSEELYEEGMEILADLFADDKWRTEHNDVYGRMVRLKGETMQQEIQPDQAVGEISEILSILMSEGHSRTVHYKHGERIEAFQSKLAPAPAP